MKIAVIGASRGTGFELVKLALLQRHTVSAFARQRGQLTLNTPALEVIEGDAMDRHALQTTIDGKDVVCCCIGMPPARKRVYMLSASTKNIIDAMRKSDVRRLICVTGIGAGDSAGHGGFFYDLLVMPILLRRVYDDKNRQEELVRGSNIDWTIVRPALLTDGRMAVRYRALTDLTGVTAQRISRADVAHFIVGQVESPTYRRQTVLLTN